MTSVSGLSSGSLSGLTQMRQSMFTKMDTDSSGTVSKEEFVNVRPQDVSAEDSAALYDKIDTSGSNALTQTELDEGMEANKPDEAGMGMAGALSSDLLASLMQLLSSSDTTSETGETTEEISSASTSTPPSASEMFSAMDTDSSGDVTEEEFVAARPDDVSEEQASALYASIDTEGTGSITESQFSSSMTRGSGGPPPGGPPPGAGGASSSEEEDWLEEYLAESLKGDSTSTSVGSSESSSLTSSNSAAVNLQDFLKALESYISAAGYGTSFDSAAAFTSVA